MRRFDMLFCCRLFVSVGLGVSRSHAMAYSPTTALWCWNAVCGRRYVSVAGLLVFPRSPDPLCSFVSTNKDPCC